MDPGPVVRFTDPCGLAPERVRCVVTWHGEPPLVADTVALFDSLGLRVARHASTPEGDCFDLIGSVDDAPDTSARLTEAFRAIHLGHAEGGVLNRLVLRAGIDWRQVMLVRALCRYLRQAGPALGLEYVEQILLRNTDAVRVLVALFEARFDPDRSGADAAEAEERADSELTSTLDAVATLDEDRVLRSLAEVVRATVRTSYYCRDSAGAPLDRITLKIEAGRLSFVAPPRPLVETWVYSPEVEGLHLRTARVARGGLRWSARPEDFRAEVLGLMKAQAVKNSVIVPAGAKGAFVVRRSLDTLSAEAADAVVRRAYASFIRGLLDVTDNLVDGAEVPPARVRRHDGTDAYLVVAADKGTSTYSDLANSVAADYDFWLGDAFASGGSAGYDHKRMGITARGAWVSVEAHLREIGLDPAREEFTVVGIGDLSGDVFGNGMLLSERIRLVAAFDHRHIFLDPDPDPETSFAERRRVFGLAASDWSSYDAALISRGGGVYSRRAKRIPLAARVKERLGIDPDRAAMTPDELVTAILCAPVSLLWNGGIGTYVKAGDETHADAGDKANDGVRIDAAQLRCRIVGEGGNLGLTQRARIEYARRGGRINADFVDNSAGVDTSDHEVNLKILIDSGIATGRFAAQERGKLLASMQEAVAASALQDNHDQSLAISLAVRSGATGLDRHARLIALLERDSGLDRQLEQLPDDDELSRRRSRGEGLSRPEVATLLAWSKTSVRAALLESDLPDEPAVQALLETYFPKPVRDRDLILSHPLAREIAGTVLANDLVNQAGPGFFCRLEERNGARLPEAAAAFLVARESFGLRGLWRDVCTQVGTAEVAVVFSALEQIQTLQDQAANWLLKHGRGRYRLESEITTLAQQVAQVREALTDALDEQQAEALTAVTDRLVAGGLPRSTALRVAQCVPLTAALDIIRAGSGAQVRPEYAAAGFFESGRLLDLAWLRSYAAPDQNTDRWSERAWSTLTDELLRLQGDLTADILSQRSARQCSPASAGCDHQDHRCDDLPPLDPRELVARWAEQNAVALDRFAVLREELRAAPSVELPMLVVAVQQMRELMSHDC